MDTQELEVRKILRRNLHFSHIERIEIAVIALVVSAALLIGFVVGSG